MGCLNSTAERDGTAVENGERSHLTRTSERNTEQAAGYGSGGVSSSQSTNIVYHKGSETLTKSSASSQSVPVPASNETSADKMTSAKPIGQFQYLDKSYKINVPTCALPQANELFKSICERYDIAVVNREKVDEALTDFKKVLGMDLNASLEECFAAWKDLLVNPIFTISCKEGTGDVKDIRVRAKDIPVPRRKAQKHMRDLLDASHLFLQQREFLQRHIINDMSQLEQVAANLQMLANEAKLSSSEKRHLPKIVSSAQQLFAGFPDVLEMFWRQVYSLMRDINTAIHVLDGVSEPGSLATQ